MKEPEADDALVLVGEIVKAHGIKGEMKLVAYSGEPDNFAGYKDLYLEAPSSPARLPFTLRKSRSQGQAVIIALAGVDTRNRAEELAGCKVWVARGELPELGEDEFFWQDLEGMDVVTVAGLPLGKVTGFLATGAHDVLVIAGLGREYMIPAVEEFIAEIDFEASRIVVDPPEGLLEINT